MSYLVPVDGWLRLDGEDTRAICAIEGERRAPKVIDGTWQGLPDTSTGLITSRGVLSVTLHPSVRNRV